MNNATKSIWAWMLMGVLVSVVHAGRVVEPFNEGWRFIKGEQGDEVTQVEFDDSGWDAVYVPHDWAISGPFDANDNGDTAASCLGRVRGGIARPLSCLPMQRGTA